MSFEVDKVTQKKHGLIDGKSLTLWHRKGKIIIIHIYIRE